MKKRVLSMLMIVMMVMSMLPSTAFAAERDGSKAQVRVIIENTTYSESEGAPWDGTLVDTWVDISSSSSMMSCVEAALNEYGYTQTGAESGFISEINGLTAGAPDPGSGWMGTLNDWFVNEGLDAFTVSSGKLESGDEIRILFSSYGYGEDLGGSWSNNNKAVKALSFSAGYLSPGFSSGTHEYILTVPEGTKSVKVTPTAANKNFQVRTSVEGTEYKRTASVPVADGTEITVTCGDNSWPSMNAGEFGSGAESVPAEVYTITVVEEISGYEVKLPKGDGFKVTGESFVEKGEDYIFRVEVDPWYDASGMKVYVNDEVTTAGEDGNFIVNDVLEDLEIKVEGVTEMPLLTVTDNVIDITDKVIGSWSKYQNKVTNITVNGAGVVKAKENGTTVDVLLAAGTSNEELTVTFGKSVGLGSMTQSVDKIQLQNGSGSMTVVMNSSYVSSLMKGSATYTINFTSEVVTEVPAAKVESDSCETYKNVPLELNLGDYFKGATEFYLVEDGNKTPIEGSKYSVDVTTPGTQSLTFAAANKIGDCPDLVTVTVEVKDIESGLWLGIETSNGSVDFVTFSDADENKIDGIDVKQDGTNINVTLPKTYDVSGKITAKFTRTANSGGYPFLTPNNAFNRAAREKTDTYTATLSGGAAKTTLYLYNSEPKAVSNIYTTYTINYQIKNEMPVLAEGQEKETSAEMVAGQEHKLNLEGLFTDADGDELTYLVSINGADPIVADSEYVYTTSTAGEYRLVFTATDGKAASSDTYTVYLTVTNVSETDEMTVYVPEGLEPAFYAANGYNGGTDVLGDVLEASAGETVDGMTAYTVKYPANVENISIRTEEWGGMSFPAEKDGTVMMRQVKLYAETLNGELLESTPSVTYGEYLAAGENGQYLLVTGNEYVFAVTPSDTASYENASRAETLEAGDSIYEIGFPLKYKNAKTITAPNGAKVQLFDYNKYYDMTEIETKGGFDNGNGTTTWYFTSNQWDLSYRVSMEGKITKAGYWEKNLTVTFDEDDAAPDSTVSTSTAANVNDGSVLVNINSQNNLAISAGGSYTIKGYRAWEIIKLSYQNEIITPDFNFEILSGGDVISLENKDSRSNGGSEESGDWKTVNALKNGVAIVEVSYDAIEISGGSWPGVYGASDPARTGLVVVQVGGHDGTVDFGIDSFASQGSTTYSASNAREWDAEFDTLYFTGEYGQLQLSPTSANGITEVAVSNNKGSTWTVLTDADGVYTAKIVSGNNIIRVTTGAGSSYQVVRGDKISTSLIEADGDGDGIIEAGETVRVIFSGLHATIPKMAGNYNPGFGGNTDGYSQEHIKYTFAGSTISGPGAQYTFAATANYIDAVIPADYDGKTISLTDGYIGVGVIGHTAFASGGDSHRNIPDAGCGTRGSETTFNTRSILPEITIDIGGAAADNNAPEVNADAVKSASIEMGQKYALNPETLFSDPEGDELTYTISVNGNEPEPADSGYKFTPEAAGEYTLTFTASDGEAQVSHSIVLTVTETEDKEDKDLVFDIKDEDIAGYVTVGVEDKGVRDENATGLKYPVALGTIVENTKVPFKEGDSAADVTLRLFDAMGMECTYSGTAESGFYLSSIKNFVVDGTPYDEMGEFDAGSGSGWMITHNDEFIQVGASEVTVNDGDTVTWKYTCQLGADIGDPYYARDVQKVVDLIDAIGEVTADSEDAIKAARAAYNKLDTAQKAKVTNYATLTAAEDALAQIKADEPAKDIPDFEKVYKETGDYMEALGVPTVNSVGGDWMAMGLERSDRDVSEKYYDNVVAYVKENINEEGQLHRSKSTENARVILALTAAGYDPSDVAGYNLLKGLTDMEYVQKQGINGPIWALIAFDSHGYEIPEGGNVTREALINKIVAAQLQDGGWALEGESADADITGMALQALAPYYKSNVVVKAAVDKALKTLSDMQNPDGSFGSIDGASAESCAQVVVALTALGIDPDNADGDFAKNNITVLDALLMYSVDGGGFGHISNKKVDGMATEQGYYALAAYDRFLNGKTSLYDMSDVEIAAGGEGSGSQDTDDSDKSEGEDSNTAAGKTKTKSVSLKLKKDKDKGDSKEDDKAVPVQTNPSISDFLNGNGVIWPWILLGIAALAGIILIIVIKKRKSEEE